MLKPTRLHDFAVVGLHLGVDFRETRKILILKEKICGFLHFRDVQVAVKEIGIIRVERVLRARDIIMIGARNGIETGVQIGRDLPNPINHDVLGQKRIHLTCKRFRILDFAFQIEMGVIVSRMNARIGSSAARDGNSLPQFEAQATFHRSLNAWRMRLNLIAVVAATVVGHVDEIPRHRVAFLNSQKYGIILYFCAMIYQLNDDNCFFPPVDHANRDGLLAFGGDLTPQRLIMSYANGIFPWYNENEPILWWSLDPRLVIRPGEMKVSKSLRHTLRSGKFEMRIDTRFREVMTHCAETPREGQDGTWILDEMIEAYCHLHELGIAHSFECYLDGKLVGGLYGVSIGKVFFGESMFHTVTDASKVAFYHLHQFLKINGFKLIDCQQETSHLMSLGAYTMPRSEFINELKILTREASMVGNWGGKECAVLFLHIEQPEKVTFRVYD